jgi:hypothetical protein
LERCSKEAFTMNQTLELSQAEEEGKDSLEGDSAKA